MADYIAEVIESPQYAVGTGVNDVIVVEQSDGRFLSTPIVVQFGTFDVGTSESRENEVVTIIVNGQVLVTNDALVLGWTGKATFASRDDSIHVESQEWKNANLNPGLNPGKFWVENFDVVIEFNVFLYNQSDKLVITDIDGTITQSDLKGHILPRFGLDADHERVVEMFHMIGQNGYKIVYLTARSIAQGNRPNRLLTLIQGTREYLFQTLQDQDGYSLPMGPVFLSPRTFIGGVIAELSDPAPMKTAMIKSVTDLFDRGAEVFCGAYGNKETDSRGYVGAGIDEAKIFIVDTSSVLRRFSDGEITSYGNHEKQVDELYPKF